MIIVTTPMCEEILKLAGITDYKVNRNPDAEEADLAILLSESKVKMNSLHLKLNTFSQIRNSILKVSKYSQNNHISNEKLDNLFKDYKTNYHINKKVKVYSNFLKDIAIDMGLIIDNNDYEYVIYPDYLKNKVLNESKNKLIEIPSHSNSCTNPIERCSNRYEQIYNFIFRV